MCTTNIWFWNFFRVEIPWLRGLADVQNKKKKSRKVDPFSGCFIVLFSQRLNVNIKHMIIRFKKMTLNQLIGKITPHKFNGVINCWRLTGNGTFLGEWGLFKVFRFQIGNYRRQCYWHLGDYLLKISHVAVISEKRYIIARGNVLDTLNYVVLLLPNIILSLFWGRKIFTSNFIQWNEILEGETSWKMLIVSFK